MIGRRIAIFAIVLLLILFGGIFLRDSFEGLAERGTPSFTPPKNVTVLHTYENGVHELRGELVAPTPCYELTHEMIIMESFPEQVRIDMTVEKITDHCIQATTKLPFTLTATTSPQARFSLRINGTDVPLELTKGEDAPATTLEEAEQGTDIATSTHQ